MCVCVCVCVCVCASERTDGQNIPGINISENNVTEGKLVRVQGFWSPKQKAATVVHIHTPVLNMLM